MTPDDENKPEPAPWWWPGILFPPDRDLTPYQRWLQEQEEWEE